jgi:hypothetical protein
MVRRSNPKPAKAATDAAHGNFLFLMAEMEASLVRGNIQWTAESAQAAQRRLVNMLAELGVIASRPRED